jgi:hypothetical protein
MDSLLRGCCNGTNGGPAMNRMSMLTIGIAAGSDATVPGGLVGVEFMEKNSKKLRTAAFPFWNGL